MMFWQVLSRSQQMTVASSLHVRLLIRVMLTQCTWLFQVQSHLWLTIWQYVPVRPQKSSLPDSNLLAKMEKALFEVKFRPCEKLKRICQVVVVALFLSKHFSVNFYFSQMDLLLQWAEQSKLLQRAQERDNNEDGVGCLGTQVSLLDPKLMPKEPKTRRVLFEPMLPGYFVVQPTSTSV